MLKQIFFKLLFQITLDRKHNNIYIILAELTGVARGIYNHKFLLGHLHINSEKLFYIDYKKYM